MRGKARSCGPLGVLCAWICLALVCTFARDSHTHACVRILQSTEIVADDSLNQIIGSAPVVWAPTQPTLTSPSHTPTHRHPQDGGEGASIIKRRSRSQQQQRRSPSLPPHSRSPGLAGHPAGRVFFSDSPFVPSASQGQRGADHGDVHRSVRFKAIAHKSSHQRSVTALSLADPAPSKRTHHHSPTKSTPGIGRHAAEGLVKGEFVVLAGVRKLQDADPLVAAYGPEKGGCV